MAQQQQKEILGIRYNDVTLREAAQDVARMAQKRPARYVVTPNPEISETCRENSRLREAVAQADYTVPDGIGVIFAARILGTPLKERVGGYDLALALLPLLAQKGLRLFLLGAKPGVAQAAAEKLTRQYGGLVVAGMQHGYFDEEREGAQVIAAINEIRADVVFVALGSPRQEIWMHNNREKLGAGLLIGLGGCFDVFAGITKRAPKLFIRLNLEWLYRLIRQPWRFVRMLKLPKYLLRAVFARLLHRPSRQGANE